MHEQIEIVVVDDHPLYRDGVVKTLKDEEDMVVLDQGASGADAIRLSDGHEPDIILLDISMPGNGVNAAQSIARSNPNVKIIMLTVSENDTDIMKALEVGARGYVLKGVSAPELVSIVRTVAAGGSYVTPSLATRILMSMNSPMVATSDKDMIDSLTKREEQILKLVADGKSNKEVGKTLGLQEKTVRHYMTNILQKMQVRNRVEAAIKARDVWSNSIPG